ncbi:MAG: transcriptional repressor [Planctomycetota bacterium]
MRNTKQLRAIREAMHSAGRPLAVNELHELAGQHVPSLGLATVYRLISSLVEQGEIATVDLPGQPPRYETAHAASHHHHHFHCLSCDKMFDLDGCTPGIESLAQQGFTVTDQ